MTSWTAKQTTKIHISPNISGSTVNQAIKFGQLIEDKMTNVFLKKWYTKRGGETSPRPFSKNSKLRSTEIWNFIQFVFIVCPSRVLLKYIKPKVLTTCFYLVESFFLKKNRYRTSLPASFYASVLKKNISHVIFYSLTKSQCLIAFTSWDIGQYVYCNCFLPSFWLHRFWN